MFIFIPPRRQEKKIKKGGRIPLTRALIRYNEFIRGVEMLGYENCDKIVVIGPAAGALIIRRSVHS